MASKIYEIAFQLGAKVASNFGTTFNAATKNIQNLENQSKLANKSFLNLGQGASKIATAAMGVAGIVGAGLGFEAMFSAAEVGQQRMAQMDAVIKSTGGAAGMTKEQLIALAAAQGKVTTFSKGANMETENLLLTFTNIGQNVFPDALKSVNDMSQALGQDTKSSAIQLGKALNDPVSGITSLSRVGVKFTKEQKDQIAAMVKMGDTAGAQSAILKELQTEFGGSAEAVGKTFGGQVTILKNNISGVGASIASTLMPSATTFMNTINNCLPAIQNLVVNGINTVMPYISGIMSNISKIASQSLEVFKPLINAFKGYSKALFGGIVSILKDVGPKIMSFGSDVINSFMKMLPSITKFYTSITSAFITILPTIKSVVKFVVDNILPPLASGFNFIATNVIPALVNTFATWIPKIANFISNLWIVIQPILLLIITGFKFVSSYIFTYVSGTLKIIGDVASGIFSILDGIVTFVSGVFTGNWGQAWQGVIETFGGIFSTLGSLIKAPINAVITLINSAFAGISQVSVKIPDWVPGIGGKEMGIQLPQIPMLANGGYIKHRPGGILANIGEGREDEIVSPVSKLKNIIGSSNNSTVEQPNFNFTVNLTVQGNASKDDIYQAITASESEFERKIDSYFKKKQRLSFS